MHRYSNRRSIFLILGLLAGCSTYEVRDTYSPAGQGESLGFKQEDVELKIGISPDTRFYSIGVLGIPVVPTYFNSSDSKTILLDVELTLRHEREFSFASSPCLGAESPDALCPTQISITAMAFSIDEDSAEPDKQKRWRVISTFNHAKDRTLNVSPSGGAIRIDRRRIYQHYGYEGEPKFGHMLLRVRYTYNCSKECPTRLTLKNIEDIVTLENLSIPARNVDFEKTRRSDYRPMTVVQ